MGLLTTTTGRRMIDGTARILLAEALFPLTAVITTGFLTRWLGPQGYGLLALTLTAIIWIESAIVSFFGKATIKFVGEADDWKPLAVRLTRLSLMAGTAAMVLVWLFAGPISVFLHEPTLAFYLRLAAVDIPILCVGQVYRSILIGTRQYSGSAVGRAGRWVSRLGLVLLLVSAGLSVTGALLGVIGSSIVELLVSRVYLGSGLLSGHRLVAMPIQRYGVLLFISSLCVICYNGMDLFMLKILGGTPAQAGVYSAAQSLSLLPGLISWTFSSLLLATLSRLLAEGKEEQAKDIARDAMRLTLWLMPVAAIVAGAASDIVFVVFGSAFQPAASLLALLILGAVANVLLLVALTIMTAAGLPARTVLFTAPLVPLALAGHVLLIPRLGALGAALVTVVVSVMGASAAVTSVYALWKVSPPIRTFLRSLMIGLAVGAASMLWLTPGLFVFAKLIVLGVVSLCGYWCLGEFPDHEVASARGWFTRKSEPARIA